MVVKQGISCLHTWRWCSDLMQIAGKVQNHETSWRLDSIQCVTSFIQVRYLIEVMMINLKPPSSHVSKLKLKKLYLSNDVVAFLLHCYCLVNSHYTSASLLVWCLSVCGGGGGKLCVWLIHKVNFFS